MGAFAEWQPRYAERGVPTFPVEMAGGRKKPVVRGYLRVGCDFSRQLVMKFPDAAGIGFAVRRARLTVLDVDTRDERVLADALGRHGATPIVVRSGSGHFQAWYRNKGETRHVRPEPDLPIDVLGNGFIVAPPSVGVRGEYTFVQGGLDDLASLPPIVGVVANDARLLGASVTPKDKRQPGDRNNKLWRWCMRAVRQMESSEKLLGAAMRENARAFYEPLPDSEVLRIVASAMDYEQTGRNYIGQGACVVLDRKEIDGLMHDSPDAFILLTKLKRNHWGRSFVAANAMAETMPCGGWTRKRFAAARKVLIDRGLIVELRAASRAGGATLFAFKGGQR